MRNTTLMFFITRHFATDAILLPARPSLSYTVEQSSTQCHRSIAVIFTTPRCHFFHTGSGEAR